MKPDKEKQGKQRREQRNRRAERIARKQERCKEKRRRPYTDSTRLMDLVRPEHLERLDYVFKAMAPYLVNPKEARRGTYIAFNLEKLRGHHQVLYRAWAKFLYGRKGEKVLKVSVAALARYLTEKKFCNLSIQPNTLIARIKNERRWLNLT